MRAACRMPVCVLADRAPIAACLPQALPLSLAACLQRGAAAPTGVSRSALCGVFRVFFAQLPAPPRLRLARRVALSLSPLLLYLCSNLQSLVAGPILPRPERALASSVPEYDIHLVG